MVRLPRPGGARPPAHLAACDPSLADAAPRFREFADLHVALLRAEPESALVLTARLHLLRSVVLAEGTYDRLACHLRKVGRLVMESPTPSILLYHGHPSRDPTPSSSDWALIDAVRAALATLDASLFDHIICAGAATVSMAQLEPGRFDPCDGRALHRRRVDCRRTP